MVRLSIALGLALGIVGCGFEFYRDLAAARIGADAAAAARTKALPPGLLAWEAMCGNSGPTRALRAGAEARASAVDGAPAASRDRRLGEAEERLAQSLRQEPFGGESWIETSYVRVLRDGVPSSSALDALARSYRIDHFSRPGALWRLRLADAGWSALTPEIRARALDEALWLWTVDDHERDHILECFRDRAARAALSERLRSSVGAYARPYS